MTRSFTGMLGRSVAAGVVQTATEQLTSFQVAPPSVVLKMWPVGSLTLKFELLNTKEKPEKVTYAVIPVVSAGSTAMAGSARGGRRNCSLSCKKFCEVAR